MAKFNSFEEIIAWQKARELNIKIYSLTNKNEPFKKDFGLRDQIRRSSISISSNIAEGSERDSAPDFQRFISIAKGSAAELRTQTYIAQKINILSDMEAQELIFELKAISKMLQALHNSLKKP